MSKKFHTIGNEYCIDKTGVEYIGYYCKNAAGKLYTGKNYIFGLSKLLAPLKTNIINPDPESISAEIYDEYIEIDSDFLERKIVYAKDMKPTPTETEYETGYMTRYMVRERSGRKPQIIEVDKKQYEDLAQFNFYDTFKIKWLIVGPLRDEYNSYQERTKKGVIDENERILLEAEDKFKGISDRFSFTAEHHYIK